MGLFKKSKNNDEDFILELSPEDEEIPVIDKEKVKAPHAMTIDEILGVNSSEKPQKTSEASIKEDVPEEEIKEEPKMEINEPKEEKKEAEVPQDSATKKAQKLIESLKKKALEQSKEAPLKAPETTPKTQPIKTPMQTVEPEKTEIKEETKQEVKENISAPQSEKKEIKLSPAAQALYDRMMAQRAKQQSATKKAEVSTEEKPKEDIKPLEASINPPKPHFDTFKPATIKTTIDIKKEEAMADAIFNSLSSSLSSGNPLSIKKAMPGSSLLSKCKNYVEPQDKISPDSIDAIIHNAEQGARDRLSNFYSAQESDSFKEGTQGYDFSHFTTRHTTEIPKDISAKDISMPIKIVDESSDTAVIKSSTGDIKNFQFSFADGSQKPMEYEDISSTRTVDIPTHEGHQADPIKAEGWRVHLEALAAKDPTAEIDRVKFTGTAEVEIPEVEIPQTESEVQMEDYREPEDAVGIKTDLASKKVSLVARLLSSSIISALLFIINYAIKGWFIATFGGAFAIVNVVLMLALVLINLNTMKGFGSILFSNPDMDSPCALAMVSGTVYTLITAILGNMNTLPILTPVCSLTLVFNLLGKLSILKRIKKGFDLIATDERKKAVVFVEDKLSASVMANGSVIGEALICQGKETKNIRDYLKNAYSEDLYEKKLKPLVTFTLIAALVFAVAGFIVNGLAVALLSFSICTILACPPSSLFVCNLPFSFATKNLEAYGAMIAGHAAAENISNANAVAFDAAELFPEGTIKLYNMQVLNKGAVDKYITYAAAVLKEASSPLSPIFEEMLETSEEEMPLADSIKYENNMGVSGWIGESRVFIGNRTLMEGHNIKVPSLELDKKILREGYFPVYLALNQQLCALFIVGYEADRTITYELRRLCNTGVTMLVNSNDPNITDEMLCDYFGLYPDSIKVMTVSGVSAYKKNEAYKENISAPAAFTGSVCALLATVTASIRLKTIIKVLSVMQIIAICIGMALCGYYLLAGLLATSSSVLLVLFQLITTGIIFLTSYFKQP